MSTEHCETCGFPLPQWTDIATALENHAWPSEGFGAQERNLLKAAVRELRNGRTAQNNRIDDDAKTINRHADEILQLRRDLRDAHAANRLLTVEVLDVSNPGMRVTKQVRAVHYVGGSHYAVEIV